MAKKQSWCFCEHHHGCLPPPLWLLFLFPSTPSYAYAWRHLTYCCMRLFILFVPAFLASHLYRSDRYPRFASTLFVVNALTYALANITFPATPSAVTIEPIEHETQIGAHTVERYAHTALPPVFLAVLHFACGAAGPADQPAIRRVFPEHLRLATYASYLHHGDTAQFCARRPSPLYLALFRVRSPSRTARLTSTTDITSLLRCEHYRRIHSLPAFSSPSTSVALPVVSRRTAPHHPYSRSSRCGALRHPNAATPPHYSAELRP